MGKIVIKHLFSIVFGLFYGLYFANLLSRSKSDTKKIFILQYKNIFYTYTILQNFDPERRNKKNDAR